MMRKSLVFAVSGTLTVAMLMACGSKKDAVAPQPAWDAGPMPSASAGPVMMPVDAGAPGATMDAGGGLAAVGDALADGAIDLAIGTAGAKAAPKMDKEGATTHTTVKEGDHFGMAISMQPGRCYTIVGYAPPGSVTQLELKLLGVPLNNEAGHSPAGEKNMPVIGKGAAATCPVLPVAMPYKIDAAAVHGAGRIGIQVFSRPK